MALGDAFPASFKAAAIKRQLRPGVVVKIETTMDDGEIHEKRFVILRVDEATSTFTCVINSRLSRIIANNPAASQCQVRIDRQTHPFMDWDSHIDCSRIRQYSTDDMCEQLAAKPDWVLGNITSEIRDQIVSALKFSRTIASVELNICSDALAGIE
jgi:hypothetical protein